MAKELKDVVEKFMAKYPGLFDDLANCIICPACKRKVRKPFYNLGPKFNSFEGCEDCAKAHNPDGNKETS